MTKNIVNTDEVTGGRDRTITPKGDLIPFPGVQIDTETTTTNPQRSIKYEPNYYEDKTPKRPWYSKKVGRDDKIQKTLNEYEKGQLKDAFFSITDACDTELEAVERSNCFDEWKDLLYLFSREAGNLSAGHREILGALISTIHREDIDNYKLEVLKMFQDATNILRQPRVSEHDSKRVLDNLKKKGIKSTIPLAIEGLSEKQFESLERMMSELLKKSSHENDEI